MIKDVIFEGDSLEQIQAFPDRARQRAGYEVYLVQIGKDPTSWKPFSSIGFGVREIRIVAGLQYRVIYVAKFADKVHVLHAFRKKSQKTKNSDINIARKRLSGVIRRYSS